MTSKDVNLLENSTAIILCGGRGTRLGELGKKFPKTLIKIQGQSILWYILNSLKINKFNHFILPVGYRGDQIKKFIEKKKFKNCQIDIVNTGLNSTIAQRIDKAKNFVKSENFIILNGDAIFDANLNQIFNFHEKNKKDVSFICCEAEADFGTVGVINNKVINFEKDFYPKIIKKFKSDMYTLKGFWYAVDNMKDLNVLDKRKINKKIFNKVYKLLNKLNDK